MSHLLHRLLLFLVLTLWVVIGGCRTYGGYGTEPETLEQIQHTVDAFSDALERAQGNLALLEGAAATNPMYAEAAEQYALAIEAHLAALEYSRDLAAEAEANANDYRVLNRNYGALVTEQRLAGGRYARVVHHLERMLVSPEGLPSSMTLARQWVRAVPLASRYQVTPPFYERVEYAQRPPTSLRDLVGAGADARVLSTPEPPLEEQVDTDLSE